MVRMVTGVIARFSSRCRRRCRIWFTPRSYHAKQKPRLFHWFCDCRDCLLERNSRKSAIKVEEIQERTKVKMMELKKDRDRHADSLPSGANVIPYDLDLD